MRNDTLFNLEETAHASGLFADAHHPWDVLPRIETYVKMMTSSAENGIASDILEAGYVGPDVIIGTNVLIEPGAVIKGPAIIGNDCIIRSGAYIRENVIIGNGCIIGNSTEVKNSVLFNGVHAPHYNYIGDSILGAGVHLGSGVVLSNIKTPPSSISIKDEEGESHDTGLLKFGAAIGDATEVGANAVCAPGTIIGKESIVYPLALVRGMVPEKSIVKLRQEQEIVPKK